MWKLSHDISCWFRMKMSYEISYHRPIPWVLTGSRHLVLAGKGNLFMCRILLSYWTLSWDWIILTLHQMRGQQSPCQPLGDIQYQISRVDNFHKFYCLASINGIPLNWINGVSAVFFNPFSSIYAVIWLHWCCYICSLCVCCTQAMSWVCEFYVSRHRRGSGYRCEYYPRFSPFTKVCPSMVT